MTGSGEWVQMFEGVRRRIVVDGNQLMIVFVQLDAGSVVPMHSHVHEQITYLLSGRLHFEFGDGRTQILDEAGHTAHMPSNVPHKVTTLEAATVLDVFSPPREDFRK